MAKTQEELNQLKTEYETLNKKLKDLTEDELNVVTGGTKPIGFIGALFDFPRDNVAYANSLNQQPVGELPRIEDDEKYVM